MSFLNWFGQRNGVILEFDHIKEEDLESFCEQIDEVQKYYSFVKLEELGERLKKNKRLGIASVVFKHPRKSVLLRAVPYLLEKKVPFTFAIRPDCVGVNRLPLEEEYELFAQKYAEQIKLNPKAQFIEQCWREPKNAEQFLLNLRKQLGPLPLELADPTQYFSTWGKLIEISKDWVSWGIHLHHSPQHSNELGNEIIFMRQLLGQEPRAAILSQSSIGQRAEDLWDKASLEKLNLVVCVGTEQGAVTHSSDWWNLPVWRF